MHSEPDLSSIAMLIGEPARAAILSALLDGQSLPASELAYRAQITPQTASAHLAKLTDGGLVEIIKSGRHRYYRLKNEDVAHALEALALIAPVPQVKSRRDSAQLDNLRYARTCYDHLAGKIGVALNQALLNKGYLTEDGELYQTTEAGRAWLAAWGLDEHALHKSRRRFACACLDWSERRPHLAGALGAALTAKLFERGWLIRIPGGRAVKLTDAGRRGLQAEFGVDIG